MQRASAAAEAQDVSRQPINAVFFQCLLTASIMLKQIIHEPPVWSQGVHIMVDRHAAERIANAFLNSPHWNQTDDHFVIIIGLTQLRACAPTWLAQTQPIAPWVQPETAVWPVE